MSSLFSQAARQEREAFFRRLDYQWGARGLVNIGFYLWTAAIVIWRVYA